MEECAPLKTLIVDDREDDCHLLVSILKRSNTSFEESVVCYDGESAISMLKSRPFDLLFVDYDLPILSGLEVLKQARELQPEMAVVMVTGEGCEEVAVEAMKSGAMDYWVKGRFTREGFERTIQILRERKLMRGQIKEREEELIHAERQRVMMESLGAACHHFSQPVTSVMGRLELLLERKLPLSESDREILEDCFKISQEMGDLLDRFHRIREYRTIPYTEKLSILDIK